MWKKDIIAEMVREHKRFFFKKKSSDDAQHYLTLSKSKSFFLSLMSLKTCF